MDTPDAVKWIFSGVGVAAVGFIARHAWRMWQNRNSGDVPSLRLTPDPVEGLPAPLKVVVRPGFIGHPSFGAKPMLSVTAQNHSSQPIFLSQWSLSLPGDSVFTVLRDHATGEWLHRRELRPGESFTLHIDPYEVMSSGRSFADFDHAIVRDEIDRSFASERGSVQKALESMLRARGA